MRGHSAEEHLKAAVAAHEVLSGKKPDISENAEIVARNVLHEELGYIGEQRAPYHLNEDTRDILIAHGRQDAAHAMVNTVGILRELKQVRRTLRRLIILVSIGFFLGTLHFFIH